MALCSLLSLMHDKDQGAQELAKRLRRLSIDGNRAYGLLPLPLGRPTKNIVESDNYLRNPSDAALQRWISRQRGADDINGSNAPLVRVHPLAACKQFFPRLLFLV